MCVCMVPGELMTMPMLTPAELNTRSAKITLFNNGLRLLKPVQLLLSLLSTAGQNSNIQKIKLNSSVCLQFTILDSVLSFSFTTDVLTV